MLLSIIVPIYNEDRHLERCLNSIACQNYSELEVLLVDDGSSDNSAAICRLFTERDNRFRYIFQENRGPAAARNTGIISSKGEYIGFVDADDFIESDMYSEMALIALGRKPDIIVANFIAYNSHYCHNIVSNNIPYDEIIEGLDVAEHFIKPYYYGNLGIIPSLCNKIYNSQFLKRLDLRIDEQRVRAEDYWFNFYAFKNAGTVFAIDQAFYHYCNNDGSLMKTFRENQFDLFVKTKSDLLFHNKDFGFSIENSAIDEDFVKNSNEYILLSIKTLSLREGFQKVLRILKHDEFRNAFAKFRSDRLHTKAIKHFLNTDSYVLAYMTYFAWSLRS